MQFSRLESCIHNMRRSTRKDEVLAELKIIQEQLDGDESSNLRFTMPLGLHGAQLSMYGNP